MTKRKKPTKVVLDDIQLTTDVENQFKVSDFYAKIKSGEIKFDNYLQDRDFTTYDDIFGDLRRRGLSPTGRYVRDATTIRPRDDHRGDFYREMYSQRDDPRRRWNEQKIEEGDLESRHQIPPMDRLMDAVRKHGPDKVLDTFARVLLEAEDLESWLDIVEPQLQYDFEYDGNRMEYTQVDPRRRRY